MDEMKTPKKPFIFYYIVVLLIVMALNLFVLPLLSQQEVVSVSYGEFLTMLDDRSVKTADVNGTDIVFTTDEANKIYTTKTMEDPRLVDRLKDAGVTDFKETHPSVFANILSWVLPFLFFILIGQLIMRSMMKKWAAAMP